jgi:hypothetical protein
VTVTLVLRLLREPLRADRLVGHAEIVATGESHPIRGVEDLLAVAHAASSAAAAAGSPPEVGVPRSASAAHRPEPDRG